MMDGKVVAFTKAKVGLTLVNRVFFLDEKRFLLTEW